MTTLSSKSSQSRPGVSVVIPCYNYGRFVNGAIDSVIRQTHAPLEIIIVDDGSTDHTREVVAAYGEQVRYHYKANAGLSAARNTGIAAARCPFVAFLDADDEWLPGMLECILQAFESLPDEFALVACRSAIMDVAGNPLSLKQFNQNYPREIKVKDLLLKSRFQPSGAVVKRCCLKFAAGSMLHCAVQKTGTCGLGLPPGGAFI